MLGVFLVVVSLVWKLGGAVGLLYAGLLLLATVPGLPIGFRLFGARHPAAWLTGVITGYALSSLVIWSATLFRPWSAVTVAAGWAVVTATVWALVRRRSSSPPWGKAPVWTTRDRFALILVLLLVPAIAGPPFARINAPDSQGNERIHAYFTADFVWHMAVVAELQKSAHSPRDPFLASQPLHYYWTYFLVPSAGARIVGASPQLALEINALGASLVLVTAIFLAAWAAWPGYPFTVAAATAFTIIASSAEGLAAVLYVFHASGSIAGLRDLNVDALSRGFGGLRIDDLPRAMWYTPQHAFSYAAGLAALPIVVWEGALAARGATPAAFDARGIPPGGVAPRSNTGGILTRRALPDGRPAHLGATRDLHHGLLAGAPAILVAGMLLAVSVMVNPFVGAIFCLIYAAAIMLAATRAAGLRPVLKHALAIAPVAAALAWVSANGMIAGAGGALRVGFSEPASNAPVASFILSFGPLLVLMLVGLWPQRNRSLQAVAPAAFGIALSVVLMHLLVLDVDRFWVGFRTGHLILVLAPVVVVRGLLLLHDRRRLLAVAVPAVLFLAGAPTTVIDAFNARDVANTHMGPGFHWTVTFTPAQREALAWIREHTPLNAIVQAEPVVRGRETWSLIPSYAERRMAAGLPISLMHVPDYDAKSAQVQQVYSTDDAASAWAIARSLGIDFLYMDQVERGAYPATGKFLNHPAYFTPAFINQDVAVVAVNPPAAAAASELAR